MFMYETIQVAIYYDLHVTPLFARMPMLQNDICYGALLRILYEISITMCKMQLQFTLVFWKQICTFAVTLV